MNSDSVFKKTARGTAAFASAADTPSPAHRAVLIMLDGKRPLADVYKLGAVFGDCDAIVAQLLSAELIELVATETTSSSKGARIATSAQLSAAKSAAAKHIFTAMGSDGDRLSLKIERSKSLEELAANISVASAVLRDAKGDTIAAQLETLFEDSLS
jgi:hypothetical protein